MTLRSFFLATVLAVSPLSAAWAEAAGGDLPQERAAVPTPLVYPPSTWQGRDQAVIRILDRVTSEVSVQTVGVDKEGQYKRLRFRPLVCLERPDGLPADSAVFLILNDMPLPGSKAETRVPVSEEGDIDPTLADLGDDSEQTGSDGGEKAKGETEGQSAPATAGLANYRGWMLAAEPSLGLYSSPLYDVHVVGCAGRKVEPNPPPLQSVPPSPLPPLPAERTMQEEMPDGATSLLPLQLPKKQDSF